jgi:hypothetical protein
MREVKFSTKPEVLKDQNFERICINGVPTSYTTTMGPTWEFQWYVLREIYCNAVDEGSCTMVKSTSNVEPADGKTRIYIELTMKLEDVINEWDAYFSDERDPLFEVKDAYCSYLSNKVSNQDVKVYSRINGSLYRKGVMVHLNDKYLYDYELDQIDINEDRTAKHADSMAYIFSSLALTFDNEEWMVNVLRNHESREYSAFRSLSSTNVTPSEKWVQFSKDYLLVVRECSGKYSQKIQESNKECFQVPESLARVIKKAHHETQILGMGKVVGDMAMEEIELTPKMQFLLKEVQKSLSEMGYEVPYDIHVAEFKSENVMGRADLENKKIYIADKTFEMGRRELALTLMEETEHIKSQAEDETRKFQTHIFSQWLTSMENNNGLFL